MIVDVKCRYIPCPKLRSCKKNLPAFSSLTLMVVDTVLVRLSSRYLLRWRLMISYKVVMSKYMLSHRLHILALLETCCLTNRNWLQHYSMQEMLIGSFHTYLVMLLTTMLTSQKISITCSIGAQQHRQATCKMKCLNGWALTLLWSSCTFLDLEMLLTLLIEQCLT